MASVQNHFTNPLHSPRSYALMGRGIQLITQMAMILVIPKVLTPSAYVQFSLLLPLAFLGVSLGFGWIIGATYRHIHNLLQPAGDRLRQTIFSYFGVVTFLLIFTYLIISSVTDTIYALIPLLLAAAALKNGILSILNAAEKHKQYFFANLSFALSLSVFIGMTILPGEHSLENLLVIYSSIDIVLALIGWNMVKIFTVPPLPGFDIGIAKSYFIYGLPIVINNVFVWIISLSDRYLLTIWESTENVANYILSSQLASSMITVPLMFAITIIFPKILRLDKQQGEQAALNYTHKLRKSYIRLMPTMFLCACAIVMPLKHYIYPDYELSPALIVIIILSQLINGLSHFYNKEFELNGKTFVITKGIGLGALVNTGLNIALIPIFGLMGAATATLAAYAVSVFFVYKVGKYRPSQI